MRLSGSGSIQRIASGCRTARQRFLETVGDTMRVALDGKPVGFLKSSGIAHPTKSKVEFGCMGKDGFFDDVKIWNAEPAKP